ncbi:TPA: 3-hydroxyacyl-CoA dehydrogenase NAD-binding domain-containing protein, partial [Pluralibacter gergoviae]
MSQQIDTVAVIGSGTMGAGIAEVAAMAGQQVLLHDISAEAMDRAVDGLRQRLEGRAARGKLTDAEVSRALARIKPVTDI